MDNTTNTAAVETTTATTAHVTIDVADTDARRESLQKMFGTLASVAGLAAVVNRKNERTGEWTAGTARLSIGFVEAEPELEESGEMTRWVRAEPTVSYDDAGKVPLGDEPSDLENELADLRELVKNELSTVFEPWKEVIATAEEAKRLDQAAREAAPRRILTGLLIENSAAIFGLRQPNKMGAGRAARLPGRVDPVQVPPGLYEGISPVGRKVYNVEVSSAGIATVSRGLDREAPPKRTTTK